MKKLLVVILSILIITGCGKSEEEKEKIFYESLSDAYSVIYITEGFGLPVTEKDKITLEKTNWFKVANSKYTSIEKIENMIENTYTNSISKELKEKLLSNYKEIDTKLYTTGKGGCDLGYQMNEELISKLKQNVNIVKIKGKKVKFEFNNKEYTAKLNDGHYKFEEKIFECKAQ